MSRKLFHRGYYLCASSTLEADGRFMARVAIMALGGDKTRSQRFLDLQAFASETEANGHAIAAGQEWVDSQLSKEAAIRERQPRPGALVDGSI